MAKAEPNLGGRPVGVSKKQKAVIHAAEDLCASKQITGGMSDEWWRHDHMWCHFCGSNVELLQDHAKDCPAMILDDAVAKLQE